MSGFVSVVCHSPSGRVGLSGPERAMCFAESFDVPLRKTLPGRYRVRPSRMREGEVRIVYRRTRLTTSGASATTIFTLCKDDAD